MSKDDKRRTGRRTVTEPRISVVLPALNEAPGLAALLPELPDVHELILVDGGSTDGTLQVARRIRPDVITMQQARTGRGNAVATGIARATGDVVVVLDADGSADPRELHHLVGALVAGADAATGTRTVEGGSGVRTTRVQRLGGRLLNRLFDLLFRTRATDLCYGYTAFWTDLLPVLDLPDHSLPSRANGRMVWGDGFELETVINCRLAAAGATVAEVPSNQRHRLSGDSSLHTFCDGARMLRTLGVEWWRARRATRRDSGAVLQLVREPVAEPLALAVPLAA